MTPQQRRTLEFVREFYAEHGHSPTQRELRDGLGLHSTSGVNDRCQALVEYGYLRKVGHARKAKYVPLDSEALSLSRIPTSALLAELARRDADRLRESRS